MGMRSYLVFSIGLALLAAGCAKPTDERTYTLQGQVLAVAANRLEATIKHEEIKGLMPAMTMPYKVKEAKLLDGIVPGDLITATLVVASNDAYLTAVKKVGEAPLEKPPAIASTDTPSASSGLELLRPGDAVPDTRFVDENGTPRGFGSFKGSTVVLTFIYTRCPMPTFCPLMDRHFATIQKAVKGDAALQGRVHLVSVSFDPLTDTPPVLRQHAKTLAADPAMWTFLTGDRDDIDRFAARFGVSVVRATNDPQDITHTLRTAIIGADGKLVKVYTGNEWTPEQILADLHKT
jgi:protein SCO1